MKQIEKQPIAPADFIRSPEHQHLKDIWCAARFGLGYDRYVSPCRVSVNKVQNSDTDFFIKTANGEFPFQTTIADVPGRRMTDEYLPVPDGSTRLTPYEPERGRIEGPEWIATAVRHKVGKCYSGAADLNLLVYANFSARYLDYESIATTVLRNKISFNSVWVVTNHQICSIVSNNMLGSITTLTDIYVSGPYPEKI